MAADHIAQETVTTPGTGSDPIEGTISGEHTILGRILEVEPHAPVAAAVAVVEGAKLSEPAATDAALVQAGPGTSASEETVHQQRPALKGVTDAQKARADKAIKGQLKKHAILDIGGAAGNVVIAGAAGGWLVANAPTALTFACVIGFGRCLIVPGLRRLMSGIQKVLPDEFTHTNEDVKVRLSAERIAAAMGKKTPRTKGATMALPLNLALVESPRVGHVIQYNAGFIDKLSDREIDALVAHDYQHLDQKQTKVHTALRTTMAFAHTLGFFAATDAIMTVNLPLAVAAVGGYLAARYIMKVPYMLFAAASRAEETRADIAAVALTGDPGSLGSALKKSTASSQELLKKISFISRLVNTKPLFNPIPEDDARVKVIEAVFGKE